MDNMMIEMMQQIDEELVEKKATQFVEEIKDLPKDTQLIALKEIYMKKVTEASEGNMNDLEAVTEIFALSEAMMMIDPQGFAEWQFSLEEERAKE